MDALFALGAGVLSGYDWISMSLGKSGLLLLTSLAILNCTKSVISWLCVSNPISSIGTMLPSRMKMKPTSSQPSYCYQRISSRPAQ